MLHIPEPQLRTLTRNVIRAFGTPDDLAEIVTESLIGANLSGHDSHGVIRLGNYYDGILAMREQRKQEGARMGIRGGGLYPEQRAIVLPAQGMLAAIEVDCGWGWGPPAAYAAADTAIARAKQHGVCAAVVRRCNHIMRVGQYVEHIAGQGMIGMVFTNSGPGTAPFGGRGQVLGTNPIAMGIPRAQGAAPVTFDGSTSMVAEGKLRVYRDKGVQTPSPWVIDKNGVPSSNPNDFYDGGALMPMGAYKGYALGVMVEMLGGLLSGASAAPLPDYSGGNGVLMLVIAPEAFQPRDHYLAQVERVCAALKATPPAEPGGEVLLPGEPELRARAERMRTGLPIAEATWDGILAVAHTVGVAI